jgi:hypothetical protein
MKQLISGTFHGTGAAIYVGLGFIPDFVKIWNLESATNQLHLEWSKNMRAVALVDGLQYTEVVAGGNITAARLTAGNGVSPYLGGDVMSAASTTYLVRDYTDYRNTSHGNITEYHLYSAATGHFNAPSDATYVGVGSRICIDGKWYTITAYTDDGDATNDVTLNKTVASGTVEALTSMFDWAGAAAGTCIPAGFYSAETVVNVSGNLCFFEAGQYD